MARLGPWSSKLSIGGPVKGCLGPAGPGLAVRPEADPKARLGAYLDLLHWLANEPQHGRHGHLKLPANTEDAVLDAIASLEAVRTSVGKPEIELDVTVGGSRAPLQRPDFSVSGAAANWAVQLEQRKLAAQNPPKAVVALRKRLADDPRFLAYRNLGGPKWFGKVEGLMVCEFANDGLTGRLKIGGGIPPPVKAAKLVFAGFLAAVGAWTLPFDSQDNATMKNAAAALRRLISSRENGQLANTYREAKLEARVLRGDVPVRLPRTGTLDVANPWGQFPTLWSPTGAVRELDVLMKKENVPWAIELKHHSGGGAGSYYRHAVGQAVLYRSFIRSALPLHEWFSRCGMDGPSCEAAIAVTERPGADWELRLEHVRRIAEMFAAKVVVLDTVPTASGH